MTHNIPIGISAGSLISYLITTTHCTVDIETYKYFYGEVMKMTIEGPILLSKEKKLLRRSDGILKST